MGIFALQILRKWKYSFIWNVCLYLGFSHIHVRAPGNWKYSFIWDFRLYLGFSPFPLVNGQQRNQGGSDRRTDEPDPPTFHGPKGFSSAFHGIFQIVSYYISTFYRLYQFPCFSLISTPTSENFHRNIFLPNSRGKYCSEKTSLIKK